MIIVKIPNHSMREHVVSVKSLMYRSPVFVCVCVGVCVCVLACVCVCACVLVCATICVSTLSQLNLSCSALLYVCVCVCARARACIVSVLHALKKTLFNRARVYPLLQELEIEIIAKIRISDVVVVP